MAKSTVTFQTVLVVGAEDSGCCGCLNFALNTGSASGPGAAAGSGFILVSHDADVALTVKTRDGSFTVAPGARVGLRSPSGRLHLGLAVRLHRARALVVLVTLVAACPDSMQASSLHAKLHAAPSAVR